jgi:predicted RNA-binding protein with PIN domain
MRYVVDGHNLIPKVGLNLASADDEMDLVLLLQEFGRTRRAQIEVFFDGAPAGQAGTRRLGTIVAHFVRVGTTADTALRAWLQRMHRAARSWTVVSSDREVQQAAKDAGAEAISSEVFARLIRDENPRRRQPSKQSSAKGDGAMSEDELDQWLDLFRKQS